MSTLPIITISFQKYAENRRVVNQEGGANPQGWHPQVSCIKGGGGVMQPSRNQWVNGT